MTKCYLNALGILCSIGSSPSEVEKNLKAGKAGLVSTDRYSPGSSLPLGICEQDLPQVPLAEIEWQSRNNQFAMAALTQIRDQVSAAVTEYGASRIAVVIGTSTSGLSESEQAVKHWIRDSRVSKQYHYAMHEMGATAQFVARVLGVSGPTYGISTACSSGAKAIAAGKRLIQAGLCDAVIAGGVDTLCQLTVLGFSSLEAVSDEVCNPFSLNRKGINIGEAAALFLMTGEPSDVALYGVGESSDAHHISAPDPTGAGAKHCMNAALLDAGMRSGDIDYVNLHGTATELNDQMESLAMAEIFGSKTYCNSTKSYTGHTLGAAGALEAAICSILLSADDAFLPAHLWDGVVDPALPVLNLTHQDNCHLSKPIKHALSNSFAFGGNNISLIIGRA